MNGIQYALDRVHSAERGLLELFDEMILRHPDDVEVWYGVKDLRRWSAEHVDALAAQGADHDMELGDDTAPIGPVGRAVARLSHLTERRELGLLEDLHDVFLAGSNASLAWEMLAQIAQAKHEQELLNLTKSSHPQTLRQIRWANTLLKTLSPQTLSSL